MKKIISVAALGLALAACDSDDKGMNPMNDYTFQGEFEPGSNQDFKQNAGDRVFFHLNSSNLTADAKAALDKQVAWLKKYENKNLTIEGHADERGTSEFNLALGERRAEAVRHFFAKSGIAKTRMSTVSFGKERPDVIGHDEAAWSKNRRAVTVIDSNMTAADKAEAK